MNGKIYVYFNRKKYEQEGIRKYYVGQTIRTIKARAGKDGMNYCKEGCTSKFANGIKKWGWEAFEVTVLEENIETLEELNEKEQYYIKLYDSYNNGYNSTEGGDGVQGCHHTGMYGKKHTEEAKEKNRKAHLGVNKGENHVMYGIPKTEEEKEIIRQGLKRFREENPDFKYNHKTIPVYCKELDKTFDSIEQARNYMKDNYDLCMKNLSKNLNGQVQYCGVVIINEEKTKLHWSYVNEEDKEFSKKFAREMSKEELESLSEKMKGNNYAKTSKVYCEELNMIFDSISKAQKYIKETYNTNCSNISAVCRGLRETCGIINMDGEDKKLHWKYIN